ncbi:PAS/PAC sensor hybrid histidine kinase [Candidatus Magnetomorum sp. HK-1]|nr:PAS/PAC sensor hybrid histidine kinase [Candidatus Magnetomorum sp. HK-1]
MFQDKIKYKDSLATRLLVNIFGLYFIVTVIVTIAQLSAEYHHVKKTVVKEIQMLPKTFGDGLVESLWMYNNDLLHSILVGMQEISVVSGVKIENKHGEEIDSIGNLIDKNGQYVKFDRNKRQIFHRKKDILLEKLFLYSFPLIYKDENGNTHELGKWTVYSSQRIVIDRVKYGFILILVNSIIKTLALWFIFLFVIRRMLKKPLNKFKIDIERVDFDNLEKVNVCLGINKKDELKMLENSFNDMLHKLYKSRLSLNQMNINLESIVEERTVKLSESNENLKQEINDRKLIEDALRRNEKKYRDLLENLNAGVVVHGPDSSIQMCNLHSCNLLGLTRDQMMGKKAIDPAWKFLDQDGKPMNLKDYPVKRILNTLEPIFNQVVGVIRPDSNELAWVLANGFPVLSVEGKVDQVIINFIDITEIKKTEEKLRETMQIAESSTRAKSEFLANMSHEIRTPINALFGFSQILKEQYFGPLNDKQLEYLNNIIESSNRLLFLVDDILDISRIEVGKIEISHAAFNIRQLMERMNTIFSIMPTNKCLTFHVEIPSDIPRIFNGDEYRIEQILKNLINNAIKFTEQGKIEVLITLQSKNDLLFEVRDTGIGIPADKIDGIFDQFYQVDSSYTKKFAGVGLGLAISKKLVELMGGKIWVESEENKGSSFYFTIKTHIVEVDAVDFEQKKTDSTEKYSFNNKLKILLAEDDEFNSKTMIYFLKRKGHDVTHVYNGYEVLDALENDTYDIILMDIQMPEMDGTEATKQIRNSNTGKFDPKIPIIALTAYAMKGDKERFLSAGINGYITKPVKIDNLLEKMESISKKYQSA